MLPYFLHVPAAVILIGGGLLACFFGYRLLRAVLAVYGFILGALFASSLVAASNSTAMIVSAIVGGIVGAAIMFGAFFVGVALVGAGAGAMVAQGIWKSMGTEPSQLVVILFAVIGAIGAWLSQRYVVIGGTSFGGAWTALTGASVLLAERGARRPAVSGTVWLAYPLDPAPGQRWFMLAWLVLGVAGVAFQLKGKAPAKKGKKRS
jgi:hypothetical protein